MFTPSSQEALPSAAAMGSLQPRGAQTTVRSQLSRSLAKAFPVAAPGLVLVAVFPPHPLPAKLNPRVSRAWPAQLRLPHMLISGDLTRVSERGEHRVPAAQGFPVPTGTKKTQPTEDVIGRE